MENWYSRETLLKLFGNLHHESLQNEDHAIKNLLNLIDDFQTKSLQNKKDDMRKLYEGLDARSKQEMKERYGRCLHYKRTIKAAIPKQTLNMLPPEMLMRICDFADPKSLIALRRTCRIISQCVLSPFCKSHFSERRHILSRHSLEELVKITAHPVFGPYVRTIKLGSCRLSANAFQNLDMMEEEHYPGGPLALKQAKDDIYLTVSEQGNLEYRQQGSAVLWLRQALNNIHGWDHEPTLAAWVDVSSDFSAANDPTYSKSSDSESATFFSGWGWRKAYCGGSHAATVQNYLTFEDRPHATINLLLRAAHESNCTVGRFGLSIRTSESSILYPDFGLSREEDVRTQLSSLQSLTIDACPRIPGAHMDFTTMHFIESLITRASNLTECSFSSVRIAPGRTELVSSLGDLKLHTLHLSDFETNGLVLFKILKKQRLTLKSLSLKSLRFDSGSKDMETLFLWMTEDLTLNAFNVANLRVHRSREELSLPLSKERVTYKGTEQVREGLKELLEMLKHPKTFLAMLSSPQSNPNSSTKQQTPLHLPKKFSTMLLPPRSTPSSSTVHQTPTPRLVPIFAPRLILADTSASTISSIAAPAPTSASGPAPAAVPGLTIASALAVAPDMALAPPSASFPASTAAAATAPSRKRKNHVSIGDFPRFESRQGAQSHSSKAQTVEAPSSKAWGTAGLLAALPTSASSNSTFSNQSIQAIQSQKETTYPRDLSARSPPPETRSKYPSPQHFAETGSQMFKNFVVKSNQRHLDDEGSEDTSTTSLLDRIREVQEGPKIECPPPKPATQPPTPF